MNTRGIFSALFGAVFMLGASPGMALDPTFQIAAKNIQRVPTSFKFQAAISQAKMPVGEAVFETLIVNLKKGDEPMCSETFNNVQVRDSVLNLDIGKQMSCDMDAVMAEHSGLTFQVCIGGAENCLKPVELGTVPYAVKSNFAVQAQEAHTSDISVQSHYAHRVTADRDLFESQNETIGAGYFDFYTEDTGTLATSLQTLDDVILSNDHRTEDLSVVGYTPVGTDGYVQWVPTHGATDARVLNICARNLESDVPAMLERLVFHSNLITLRGDQEVFGNAVTTGDVDIGGTLEVLSNADFYENVNIEENLRVKMESDLDLAVRANYTLTVTDHTQLNSTLTTEGATQLNGTLTADGATQLNSTLTADGATQLNSTLTADGATQLNSTLTTEETAQFNGDVNIAAGNTFTNAGHTQLDHTLTVAADKATELGGSLSVNGNVVMGNDLVEDTVGINGVLNALGQVNIGEFEQDPQKTMNIYHDVAFLGDVSIPSDSISYNFAGQLGIVKAENIDTNAVTDIKIDSMNASKLSGIIDSARIPELTDAEISASAQIKGSKIESIATSQLTGTITSAQIDNGTIVNTDISSSANIAGSKIESIATSQLTGLIVNDQLSESSVTDDNIVSIHASKITEGTIDNAHIADLSAADLGPDSVGISELDIPRVKFGSYLSGLTSYGMTDWLDSDSDSSDDRIARIRGGSSGGGMYLYDTDTELKVGLSVVSSGGRIRLYDSDGDSATDIKVELEIDDDDHGRLKLDTNQGDWGVDLGVTDSNDGGYLNLYTHYTGAFISTTTGSRKAVELSAAAQYGGILNLFDNSSSTDYNEKRLSAYLNTDTTLKSKRSGAILLYSGGDKDDKTNTVFLGREEYQTGTSGYDVFGGGKVIIYDKNGNSQAGLGTYSNGTLGEVWGDDKNFVVDHPIQKDKVIVYTSLEGSSADMYHRGKHRLENGYAEIPLPDHFYLLAEEEGMSATLTPRSAESKGLAILAIKPDRLVVQELFNGKGNYEFDYNVIATREGKVGRSNLRNWVDYRFGHIGDAELKEQISEARRNGASAEELVDMVRQVERAAEEEAQLPEPDSTKGE